MKLSTLLEKLSIKELHADPDTEIGSISYDSRFTEPGSLFVAVRGFQTDGHKYIPAAAEKGAAVILCETAPSIDIPYVLIDDCRLGLALTSAAFFHYPADRMKVVGITGTNGKTTSSYLIKHILEEKAGAKVGLIGTNGNMIGDRFIHTERTTPESYELQKLFAEMESEGCTHVVMEVSSHSLELERVAGIRFATAVFTNLTQDHLDFHGTMENYAKAKKKLFGMTDCSCINLDDPYGSFMADNAAPATIHFSVDGPEADMRAEITSLTASGVTFNCLYKDTAVPVKLAIPGRFSVYNALGSIAAAVSLGVSVEDCADALASAKGVKGRVEVVPTDGDYSILIDYAHTPDALENVLKTVKPLTRGRLIALFGCGGDRDRAKRPIMGRIAAENADVCLVTSDNPRTEKPEDIISDILTGIPENVERTVICDRIEAIHWAIDHARDGDVIVLAGKGHEDYQEINHVKHHMDEREIVADYIRERRK